MNNAERLRELARFIYIRLNGPVHPDVDGRKPKLGSNYTTISVSRLEEMAAAMDHAALELEAKDALR